MMDSMTILATDGIFKGSSSQRNSVNSLTQQYSINIHFSQSLQISNHETFVSRTRNVRSAQTCADT